MSKMTLLTILSILTNRLIMNSQTYPAIGPAAKLWMATSIAIGMMLASVSTPSLAQDTSLAQEVADDATQDASPTLTDDQFRSQVSELVDSLDAAQLAKRQQAERDLIALGPDALQFLPEVDERLSAEAQLRLRRVLKSLQEAKAEMSATAQAMRLGSVNTLDEALTRITDVSGVNFARGEVPNRPLVLTLGPQSFWPTLDTVLDAAELDVNFYVGEPGELGIAPRAEGRASRTDSAAYAGVYRLETASTTSRRDYRNPTLSRLSIAAEIAWEPRLTPIGLNLPLDSITAVLDDGQRLKPESGQIDISTNSSIPFSEFNIPLPLPTGSPQKIESLTGTIRSMLPGAREHFKKDLAKSHEPETVGNVTFWLESAKPNGTLHEVRVEVVFENAGQAFESHRQWVFENPAYVTTADGSRLEHLGFQTYRQTSDRVGIGYLFDLQETVDQKTFHYETPISIIENEVTFLMKDIQLP
jgi:hypothetical protein